MVQNSGVVSPPVAPRLVYSADQQTKLKTTAKRLTEYPFQLEDGARYLIALAEGSDEFWSAAPPPLDMSLNLQSDDDVDWYDCCNLEFAANTIEPTPTARQLRAGPTKTKFVRKRRRGRGRMSARAAADDGPPPIDGAPPQIGAGEAGVVAVMDDITVDRDGDFVDDQ